MPLPERHFSRRIDLLSLQLFVAVCETGSIGRAAEREFIAASAVSKRLADLESSLGTGLLVRHARGVAVTPAGQSLLHHARSVLFSLQQMQSDLTEYAEGVRGHVRVHASISAIVQFLPEDLGSFVQRYPQVKIDLQEQLSGDVVRAVREGTADLGICHASALTPSAETLPCRPYRVDQLALVIPVHHRLAQYKTIHFSDCLDDDHVGLHANSSISLAMQQAANEVTRTIRLRIRVTGLDAMCRMIENGLGIGIMPQGAFDLMRSSDKLRAIPLTDPWARREIKLVARDFDTLPATARSLVTHLDQTTESCAQNTPSYARHRARKRAVAPH